MPFKHSRLAAIWVNGQDVSAFLNSLDFSAKVETAETSTFGASWKTFITGNAMSQLSTSGYYDPTTTTIRTTLQAASGVATVFPAGAIAIGDPGRMLSINATDYQETDKTTEAVGFNWSVDSTSVVGLGYCLHTMTSDSVGTNNGGGDGIGTSLSSSTGAIATCHVTAYISGSQTVKFQDATTIGGAYTDIASGAFPAITATGGYRLVIPGTIRQFVRCVTIIAGNAVTLGVAFART